MKHHHVRNLDRREQDFDRERHFIQASSRPETVRAAPETVHIAPERADRRYSFFDSEEDDIPSRAARASEFAAQSQARVHHMRAADSQGPERVVPRISAQQQRDHRDEGVRIITVEPQVGRGGGSPPNIRRPPGPRAGSPPEEHRPGRRWYDQIRVQPYGHNVERPWHAVHIHNADPGSSRHRHRHRHNNIRSHLLEPHNVARDFFARGRGMMDFEELRRKAQEEERDRARSLREQAERRDRAELAAAIEALERLRDRRRSERRASSPRDGEISSASDGSDDGHDHGTAGRAYSPKRKKGKERAREKDGGEDECCERLLAFMRQEARLHREWRDEMREWRLEWAIRSYHNLTRQRTRSVSPEDASHHGGRRTITGVGDGHVMDSHTNVFSRPTTMLDPRHKIRGESRDGLPRSKGRSRSPSRRRRESPRLPRRTSLGFMFLDDGQVIDTPQEDLLPYPPRDGLKPDDEWLIDGMKHFYARRVASRKLPVLSRRKRLSLAKFVRFELVPTTVKYQDKKGKAKEDEGTRKICTAQRWLLNGYDSSSHDHFEYTIDHPLPENREWLSKMEGLIERASPDNHCIIWVYIFERIDYRFTVLLFMLYALITTAGGIAYGLLRDDIAGGLTISAYVLGVVGGATAGIGFSEYIGLEKPDNCTYAFDVVHGADEIIYEDDEVKEGKDAVGYDGVESLPA